MNGSTSTTSTGPTEPLMEKRPMKRSEKSYNHMEEMSREPPDVTQANNTLYLTEYYTVLASIDCT